MPKVKIKSLYETEPHPSYGGWNNFITTCEVRDAYRGVVHYGLSNCYYIVFPDGTLIDGAGSSGGVIMQDVREKGVWNELRELKLERRKAKLIMRTLLGALDRLTETLGTVFERARKEQKVTKKAD